MIYTSPVMEAYLRFSVLFYFRRRFVYIYKTISSKICLPISYIRSFSFEMRIRQITLQEPSIYQNCFTRHLKIWSTTNVNAEVVNGPDLFSLFQKTKLLWMKIIPALSFHREIFIHSHIIVVWYRNSIPIIVLLPWQALELSCISYSVC